jgi:hypothetical protein
VLAPLRLLRVLPLVLVALLGLESVVAANSAASSSRRLRDTLVGQTPTWIDDTVSGRASMLYGGAAQWNVVWETLFWNTSVRNVYALPGAAVLGPVPGGPVTIDGDGGLRHRGRPVEADWAVAPFAVQLAGTRTADAGSGLAGVPIAVALWRAGSPLRVLGRTAGLQPNGDVYHAATLDAFGCPGTFRLTLIAKQDETIRFDVDGRTWGERKAANGQILRLAIPSKRDGRCSLQVDTGGKLLGTTVFAFEPG